MRVLAAHHVRQDCRALQAAVGGRWEQRGRAKYSGKRPFSRDAAGPPEDSSTRSRFLAGLNYEEAKGWLNAKGTVPCAEFALASCKELQRSMHGDQQLQGLASGFASYADLSVGMRQRLLAQARAVLTRSAAAPAAVPTEPASRPGWPLTTEVEACAFVRTDPPTAASGAGLGSGHCINAAVISAAESSPALHTHRHPAAQPVQPIQACSSAAVSLLGRRTSGGTPEASTSGRAGNSGPPGVAPPRTCALPLNGWRVPRAPKLQTGASSASSLGGPSSGSYSGLDAAQLQGPPGLPPCPGLETAPFVGAVVDGVLQAHAAVDAPGEAQNSGRRRQVKAATLAFQEQFNRAATLLAAEEDKQNGAFLAALSSGEQRTAEWHQLRDKRLTASAFANALGFWPGGRVGLWEEKLGLALGFQGNAATAWGTRREAEAMRGYAAATGQLLTACRFRVLREDDAHGWLGASPDGLVDGLEATAGTSAAAMALGGGPIAGAGPGVVEIKCPWNRGQPELARPYEGAPWYYMPQVQGLMEVFGREWCNLWVWTVNGAALWHFPRDRAYWAACYDVLAHFWWAHVVPAKHALAAGGGAAAAEHFRCGPSCSIDGMHSARDIFHSEDFATVHVMVAELRFGQVMYGQGGAAQRVGWA